MDLKLFWLWIYICNNKLSLRQEEIYFCHLAAHFAKTFFNFANPKKTGNVLNIPPGTNRNNSVSLNGCSSNRELYFSYKIICLLRQATTFHTWRLFTSRSIFIIGPRKILFKFDLILKFVLQLWVLSFHFSHMFPTTWNVPFHVTVIHAVFLYRPRRNTYYQENDLVKRDEHYSRPFSLINFAWSVSVSRLYAALIKNDLAIDLEV